MNKFTQLFSGLGKHVKESFSTWREHGSFRSIFSSFGKDIYKSDVVKSCVRPLAEHTSKANPRCTNKQIERLLQIRPNAYMNGKDFLYKVRTMYEVQNAAFILINRNDLMQVTGFYPIPYNSIEALKSDKGNLYIKFYMPDSQETIIAWEDLAVVRKDYFKSDIIGDDNNSLIETLDLINTTNQGIANAVKSTANLRGIIQTKKAMLKDDNVKAMKDQFVEDYMNVSNEGGIAALDSTYDFKQLTMSPTMTNWAQMKEFRENVYRYFGISENVILSKANESEWNAFYESKIEPFLLALGLELTSKIFTDRELSLKNEVMFESSRMAYASNATKLSMTALTDRGILSPNGLARIFNLPEVEGGDDLIIRLDYVKVKDLANKETDEPKDKTEEEDSE